MTCAKRPFALSLILCLLLVPVALTAADDELTVEVVPGLQWFVEEDTPNSAKFEEYREVPNGFVADRFRLNWWPDGDRYWLDLDATDIAQDDQQIYFEVGTIDLWDLSIDWRENPHRFSDSARQLHAYQGDGVFTVSDTADLETFIETMAHEERLNVQRKTGAFTLEFTPLQALTLGVNAERERREGTQPQAAPGYPFGASAAGYEFAFPIDYETDTATGYIEWAGRLFTAGARYTFSEFESKGERLFWENHQFAEPAPSSTGQLDPSDDNEMRKWVVYLAGNLPGHTRISATASQGTIENEDTFLPVTVNPDLLAMVPLESRIGGESFDGEYDTSLYNLRISGHPNRHFSWKAWWRSYELERDAREYEITYVAADDHISEPRRSLSYGYERDNLGAKLGFSPIDRLNLGLEFERESWDRQDSPVTDSDEDRWKLSLDSNVTDWLFLRASYQRLEREADHYDFHYLDDESFPEGEGVGSVNLGSRRHIFADRDRDVASLMFEVYPNPTFSIYGQAKWYDSEYMDPNTGNDIGERWRFSEDRDGDTVPEDLSLLLAGRSDDEGSSYTLGFSVQPHDRFRLFADYTWEEYEYTLWSRQRNPGGDDIIGVGPDEETFWADWKSNNEDEYSTINLGFEATFPNEVWDVWGNFLYHEGEAHYGQEIVENPFDEEHNPFPTDTDTEMIIAKLMFNYYATGNLSFGFGYWYEKWEENDWQFDFNQPYMGRAEQDPGGSGSGTSQFLGVDFEDYENHILTFNVRYLF